MDYFLVRLKVKSSMLPNVYVCTYLLNFESIYILHQMLNDKSHHYKKSILFHKRFLYLLFECFAFSFSHRPFAGSEMLSSSHWNNRPDKLPWLQDPTTNFKLQCRQPSEPADQRLFPTEAQIGNLMFHSCHKWIHFFILLHKQLLG